MKNSPNPENEKLSEAVLFLLQNLPRSNKVGLKKIAKLLYFADFNYYKKHFHFTEHKLS